MLPAPGLSCVNLKKAGVEGVLYSHRNAGNTGKNDRVFKIFIFKGTVLVCFISCFNTLLDPGLSVSHCRHSALQVVHDDRIRMVLHTVSGLISLHQPILIDKRRQPDRDRMTAGRSLQSRHLFLSILKEGDHDITAGENGSIALTRKKPRDLKAALLKEI